MDALPEWPEGTVAVLTTRPGHAIPVSLVHRAGDRRLAVGLAPRRGSLANLRPDPPRAVTLLGPGVAFTAYGTATVTHTDPVTVVRIDVAEIADHDQPSFEITAGVDWRWTDDDAAQRDAEAREALRRLAPRRTPPTGSCPPRTRPTTPVTRPAPSTA